MTLSPLNTSYIVLIPKKDNAQSAGDLCPISLLHGIQKKFSKILSHHLQPHMHHTISDARTRFQKNRQITENYLYAQHLLCIARKEQLPLALLKLDIKKAFDMVSWSFMEQVMTHLGFPNSWITWINNSVLQWTSQVLINGLLGKKIKLKRGVHQGDPISPSLFIVAMDFLARYLQKLT